jgi:hypothetical protein
MDMLPKPWRFQLVIFNGTDPWPTLAAFETMVRQYRIHWFIAVDGVTIHDLTAPV